ncbi:chitin synthase chs-2-like, partial [Diaphorina citri]|uniref:Chitin synthase chs-2-like n=1 Tax=Diaphorina citri TaxID=121845 RepID=A0A1S3DHD5_DIACI
KYACKIMIQGFSYAFPVNLTIPVTISILITMCGLRNDDPCFFQNSIPDYLFFVSPSIYFLDDFILKQIADSLAPTLRIKTSKIGGECRDKQFAVYLPIEERIAWFWCLIAAFIVPELGTAIRSIRICYFKSWKKPPLHDFIFVTSMELLHTLGLACLVFVVLPNIDVVKGAMLTNCLCFLPAFLTLISRNTRGCTKGSERSEVYLKAMMDMIAVSAQATGALLWPLLEGHNDPWLWLIPPALFCVSCGYWENYTSKHSIFGFMKSAWRVKERLKRTRYFTYAFVSFLKILVFLCSALVFMSFRGESVTEYFSKFHDSFSQHKIRIYEVKASAFGTSIPDLADPNLTGDYRDVDSEDNFAMKILLYKGTLLITMCGLRNDDPCFFQNSIPDYLFFVSPSIYFLDDFILKQHAWVWLLWLLSQTWITLHIWTPKCERLATTEKLFVRPMYDALLIDQSMSLNRRCDDEKDVKTEEFFCIVFFSIYLLSVPSMYLLLILYSLINLNVVSWGTREVAVKKTKKAT